MSSSFPTALPNSKTDFDSNTLVASAPLNKIGEDIDAIATKLGVDGSADTNSIDYKINNIVTLEVASGAEVDTGTDDLKYVTAKAVKDSTVVYEADLPVKATGAEANVGTDNDKFITPKAWADAKYITTSYTPSGAGTTTLDLSLGGMFSVTMPASTQTLALTNETVGQHFVVDIVNTTGQGVLTWFSTIKWAGGSEPSLTGTNSKVDSFGFRVVSAGNYYGYIIGQNI